MTNTTLFPLQMEEIWSTQAFFHRSEPLISLCQLLFFLFFLVLLKNEFLESWQFLRPFHVSGVSHRAAMGGE